MKDALWGPQRRGRVGAWLAVPKRGKSTGGGKALGRNLRVQFWVGVLFFWGSGKGWLGGARARGGSKGFGSGGVGGRGTGPKKKKNGRGG